jgi:hypothetical protein
MFSILGPPSTSGLMITTRSRDPYCPVAGCWWSAQIFGQSNPLGGIAKRMIQCSGLHRWGAEWSLLLGTQLRFSMRNSVRDDFCYSDHKQIGLLAAEVAGESFTDMDDPVAATSYLGREQAYQDVGRHEYTAEQWPHVTEISARPCRACYCVMRVKPMVFCARHTTRHGS